MRKILRRLPSPAMVVACIALAVALGGTSYAAITLPRNSVGTKQLQKNSISAFKLQSNSVGPAKLKINAVTGAKVKSDSLTGEQISETTLAKVPAAPRPTTRRRSAATPIRRFATTVAPGGAEATVLNLNGLVLTLTCPAGSVQLRGNNNSGAAAQLRFDGHASNGLQRRLRGLPRDVERGSQQQREPRLGVGPLRPCERHRRHGALRLARRRSRRHGRLPGLRPGDRRLTRSQGRASRPIARGSTPRSARGWRADTSSPRSRRRPPRRERRRRSRPTVCRRPRCRRAAAASHAPRR